MNPNAAVNFMGEYDIYQIQSSLGNPCGEIGSYMMK